MVEKKVEDEVEVAEVSHRQQEVEGVVEDEVEVVEVSNRQQEVEVAGEMVNKREREDQLGPQGLV